MIRKEHKKPDAILIDTSQYNLYEAKESEHVSGVAIDVFEKEPYDGPLQEIERCFTTAPRSSMLVDYRTRMEIESTGETVCFLKGNNYESEVPLEEYEIQSHSL